MLHPFVNYLGIILLKIVCLLVAIAYYTIAERKIIAAIQRRRGPNVVGFWGLLQPLADGLKLIAKEIIIPSHSNSRIFVFAPIVILTLGLLNWSIIPFGCFDISEQTSYTAVASITCFALSSCNSNSFEYPTTTRYYSHFDSSRLAAVATPFEFLIEKNDIADVQYGVLFILALSSLAVYGLIIAGWSSNSKYAFLGALRSSAQMISYEVSINLVILPVVLLTGSLNFTEIAIIQDKTVWFIFPLLPASIIFFISIIAETNRTPFDLPEAEAEIVAGYNIEYSSIIFAMFFLAEYGNIIIISQLKTLLFLGGWSGPFKSLPALTFALKGLVFCFLFVLVRATFPRYRYDQLIEIGWKIFLPIATGFLLLTVGILLAFNALPVVNELPFAPFYDSYLLQSNLSEGPAASSFFIFITSLQNSAVNFTKNEKTVRIVKLVLCTAMFLAILLIFFLFQDTFFLEAAAKTTEAAVESQTVEAVNKEIAPQPEQTGNKAKIDKPQTYWESARAYGWKKPVYYAAVAKLTAIGFLNPVAAVVIVIVIHVSDV